MSRILVITVIPRVLARYEEVALVALFFLPRCKARCARRSSGLTSWSWMWCRRLTCWQPVAATCSPMCWPTISLLCCTSGRRPHAPCLPSLRASRATSTMSLTCSRYHPSLWLPWNIISDFVGGEGGGDAVLNYFSFWISFFLLSVITFYLDAVLQQKFTARRHSGRSDLQQRKDKKLPLFGTALFV